MFKRCTLLFVVLTISWLARASSYTTDSSDNSLLDELTKSCPSDGIPVCGMQHKQFFLFSNDCLLEEVNQGVLLGQTSFKMVPLKYCMYGCQFSCAKKYQPICARNMRTYHKQLFVNQCELTKYICKTDIEYIKIALSECTSSNKYPKLNKFVGKRSESKKTKRRPIPCTNVFKPVCGTYMGVKSSFRNECLLNAENVKFDRDWRIVKNGMCDEDYTNARQPKEKTEKSHSVKKRSYTNQLFNQYSNKPDYNEHSTDDYKNSPNLTPNGLYLYMPHNAIQTQFLNPDAADYQQSMGVPKAYDEILNKIVVLPQRTEDVALSNDENDNQKDFDDSIIKPMPFISKGVNFNYVIDPKLAHDINEQSLPLTTDTFIDENNKEYYYTIEKLSTDNENSEMDNFPINIATTISTTTETTQAPKIISATTTRTAKALKKMKQVKKEKVADKKEVECKFGSNPICGMLAGGSVRSFDTICEMMSTNVYLTNTWTKLHDGLCEDCNHNCHRDYQPVCVTRNGINYTMVNECYYNMGICMDKKSKWEKLGDGECERYTRIPDKYINSKPGFPYTSSYFVSETTTTMPVKGVKLRKNKTRKNRNPKRAVNRRYSSQRCCSPHYPNEFGRNNRKCKCWNDTSPQPSNRISSSGPQTESYIMRLVKNKVERAVLN